MKAAVARELGKPLTIEEVPLPEPGPGQVQVKIEACGVCHSDLHAVDGDWPVKAQTPFIPGHEGVGYVSGVGAGVTHVKEGDRVGVPLLYKTCGTCEYCLSGNDNLCKTQQDAGFNVDGGFAEYMVAYPEYVGHLPESVGFVEVAPILCAGVTVYRGLKETEARPGEWVLVTGIGGLGHLAIQYAKAMGFNVAAVDIDDAKLKLAESLGADATANAMDRDQIKALRKNIGGGAHGILATAISEKAFEQALGLLRRNGIMVVNGLPPGAVSLPVFGFVMNAQTIRGSFVGSRLDLQESLDFAGAGKVAAHVSAEPLENVNDIFERLRQNKIEGRVVLDFSA
jgi:propanol-preferring alcohol dehydrogenase